REPEGATHREGGERSDRGERVAALLAKRVAWRLGVVGVLHTTEHAEHDQDQEDRFAPAPADRVAHRDDPSQDQAEAEPDHGDDRYVDRLREVDRVPAEGGKAAT